VDKRLVARGFRKLIPTDLEWSGNYLGGYCEVRVSGFEGNYSVVVSGNDDCVLIVRRDSWEEALALYNKISYIQSDDDLVVFSRSKDNNGWPRTRVTFTNEWYEGQQMDNQFNVDTRAMWDEDGTLSLARYFTPSKQFREFE